MVGHAHPELKISCKIRMFPIGAQRAVPLGKFWGLASWRDFAGVSYYCDRQKFLRLFSLSPRLVGLLRPTTCSPAGDALSLAVLAAAPAAQPPEVDTLPDPGQN
jgi:hypothetical protein